MPAITTIKLRRGTSAQWAAANPVLAAGEPGLDTDTGVEKRGDGVTAWASLPVALAGTYVGAAADNIATAAGTARPGGPNGTNGGGEFLRLKFDSGVRALGRDAATDYHLIRMAEVAGISTTHNYGLLGDSRMDWFSVACDLDMVQNNIIDVADVGNTLASCHTRLVQQGPAENYLALATAIADGSDLSNRVEITNRAATAVVRVRRSNLVLEKALQFSAEGDPGPAADASLARIAANHIGIVDGIFEAYRLRANPNEGAGVRLSKDNDSERDFLEWKQGSAHWHAGFRAAPYSLVFEYQLAATPADDTGWTTALSLATDGSVSTGALTSSGVVTGTAGKFGTTPATVGTIRIPNNSSMFARNAANTADVHLVSLDGVDVMQISSGASSKIAIGSASSLLHFFGGTPVAKPTGVTVDAAGIHAALVTLGLIAA